MERILGIGTIHCFTGDVTDPDLKLQHIKNAKEIKDFILKQSEQERLKRKTLNMQHLDGNPVFSYFFTITIKSVSEHLKYIRIIIITDSIRRKI